MFHMLSCINLKPDVSIDEFRDAVAEMTALLQRSDLLHATGPIGRRQRHPVMDTDAERDHEYFFIMSFTDRAQCDRAVEKIYKHEDPQDEIHKSVYARISNPVFICWEDLDQTPG